MIESVSRRAFSGSSGTYHVRASELAVARDRRLKSFSVTVVFLDDTTHSFTLEKRAKGAALLEQVFLHLELIEKDYFGLQFSENGSSPNSITSDYMRWLEATKSVKKQLGGGQNVRLYFRVKFYVSDPSKLVEEFTRYQFYLQLRSDIIRGRIVLPPSTACLLASYMVQSELGDYQPEEHGPNYLSDLKLVPGQTEDMESKIVELHKLHKGQLPADAEFNFLDHAKRLDMYGVELHRAQDSIGRDIQLGVTSTGLVVFQNSVRVSVFSWSKIVKISFKRKQFFIQLRREPSETYDTLLGFNMHTYRSSKGLWKACVEHHTFFRLHSPRSRRRFPLSLGSRFHFSGRTESQTVEQGKLRTAGRPRRPFTRSPSGKQPIGATVIAAAAPLASAPEDKSTGKPIVSSSRSPWCDNKVTSLGAREPRKAWQDSAHASDDDGGFLDTAKPGSVDATAVALGGGVGENGTAFCPPPGRVLGYADDDGLYDTPPYSPAGSPLPVSPAVISSEVTPGALVTVRLLPDEQGRFGFNVKGGLELDMPILVSRVAPNTPADRCSPRLREGDQLLLINGHDVSRAPHSVVVALIRAVRDEQGELVMTVRPAPSPESTENGGAPEEPPYCYVPQSPLPLLRGAAAGNMTGPLAQSMLLLADGLASGALVAQYEQLYRRHPELSCDEARRPENAEKNRYRDISPYDATRVALRNGLNGDYINANYVNMHINGTDSVNRYIATQGPLSSTIDDFWQMILESECHLIVMLTTLIERGRIKCHQYWPETASEALRLRRGELSVSCASERRDASGAFVFRELVLRDMTTGAERVVEHMQYIAWPDHGVPMDPDCFVQFVQRMRDVRSSRSAAGADVPVVVHCSAGIGRTGVLILMDTAMCLAEAGQPVYPLDIVQTMRDQRAMMIQNASQYRFVCESVHTAFVEGVIHPEAVQEQPSSDGGGENGEQR